MLLGLLFVCDTGKFHQERFVLNTNNLQSTVVFMPLKKRVTENNKAKLSGSKKAGARKVISQRQYEKQLADQKKKSKKIKAVPKKKVSSPQPLVQPIAQKVIEPVVKPEPVKKSPTILQQSSDAKALAEKEKNKKIEADKKAASAKLMADKKKAAELAKAQADKAKLIAAQKKIADKKTADAAAAKALAAKIADKKKIEDKKNADKLAADKKQAVAKQDELKQQELVKVSELEQATIKADEALAKSQAKIMMDKKDVKEEIALETYQEEQSESDDGEDYIDIDTISFVGSHDLEMMQIKEQIQGEIVKYYKPPVGISKKAVCELIVLVGVGGKAERVTVKKGSGSIANDICARAALLKVTFPKEVIGKEIIVELGQ